MIDPLLSFYIAIAVLFIFCLYEDSRNPNFLKFNFNYKEKIAPLIIPLLVIISILFTTAIVISLVIGKLEIAGFYAAVAFIFVLFCIKPKTREEKENARREKLAAWAKFRGWTYDPRYYQELAWLSRRKANCDYLDFFERFRQGSNRYVFDLFRGIWYRYPADAFSFHYEIEHDKSTSHYYFGVVLIYIEESFPRLTIKRRGLLGSGGISFESVIFNEEFVVRCQDKKFAYDFCHPKIMEYLLAQGGGIDIELKDSVLAIFINEEELKSEDVEESLNRLVKLRQLMPNYLYRS